MLGYLIWKKAVTLPLQGKQVLYYEVTTSHSETCCLNHAAADDTFSQKLTEVISLFLQKVQTSVC